METTHSARSFLSRVGTDVRDRFVKSRQILSFDEFMELFVREPRKHSRSAAQYLLDALNFYGFDDLQTPVGKARRFRLFDLPFEQRAGEPVPEGRVAGQEGVQNAIFRQLQNFVRAGRVNRLILLHGPNGSAKSSLIASLSRALEDYSRRDEGARYRFNWVFPSEKLVKGKLGFGSGEGGSPALSSFAHLDGEELESRLQSELKEPPLFLIPREERRALLLEHCKPAARGSDGTDDFVLSDYILDGELSQKSRAIYQALLAHYAGDWLKVMRHVQVERFEVSRRYQVAHTTIEPAMSVDAGMRQITADRNAATLPLALHNVALFEAHGPLVAGNRGLVEFADLLKRPLETFKYLLVTCETATVSLDAFVEQLDCVFIASSNEKHLEAFKTIPDFASFKGRIELVRVPYLRRFSVEKQVYDQMLARIGVGRPVAPHVTRIAAKWAVLTRLRKPLVDTYKGAPRALVDDLSPHEKLVLYDEGRAPDRLSGAQANELRHLLPQLYRETHALADYEGRFGASAREMKNLIQNAAQNPRYDVLSPLAVLEELERLVKDKSVYEFLQQDKEDGFHAHEDFVRIAEADFLEVIDEEIRDSMGLVSDRQYRDLFDRYLRHVGAWQKGERLQNPLTGDYEKPDEEFLAQTERIFVTGTQDRREFRRSVVSTIGAWRLDHPEGDISYDQVFPELFRKLRDHYYDERRKGVRKGAENVLKYLGDERAQLAEKEQTQVRAMLDTMAKRYGYTDSSARDAVVFLMRKRYASANSP